MKFFHQLPQRKRMIVLALLLLFSVLLASKLFLSCSVSSADTSFEAFTEELFRQELSSNTISLHYTLANPSTYGLESLPVTFGEYSSDISASEKSLTTYITALEFFEDAHLSDKNQLTYDILHDYLTSSADGLDYLLYQEPLSPVTGIHAQLPILLSEYQFYTASDVEVYLQLLDQTDEYFNSIITFEEAKADAGLFMPDYQMESVISYSESFIAMDTENYLLSSFEERVNALENTSDADRAAWIAQNAQLVDEVIFPAYENLISSMTKLKGQGNNEMGLCYFPDGKSFYEYLVRQEAGVTETIPELQEMTLSQIMEDLMAMQSVLSGDVLEQASLRASSDIFPSSPEEILNELKNKTTTAFPEIPSVQAEIKYVSSAMEEYLSPAFYMIPAIDNTNENVIYINQGQTTSGLNLYTTLAHEGYPGHLYQTVYFASQNPDPIRSLLNYGGYVEGWATYAEMMSYYFSPLSNTDATLLQKNNSLILGLYAYADMGIHYDGWTPEETLEFFSSYGISDEATVQSIYELIIGTPGNYSKYYLGYLKFYDLKKEIAEIQKEDFSQQEFHKAVLDVGPAPFRIVESYVKKVLLE